jgi:CheY-like chemotaxis protein
MSTPPEITIVLVEDDPGHALLIEKNLRRSGIVNPIVSLRDGRAALDFLLPPREGADAQHPSRLLLLLDLNLPVVDGYEVLRQIKADERTRRIPVVILTTTDNQQEIERCYGLGCNVYVAKPVDYEEFSDAMRKLGMFLTVVKVPEMSAHHG